MKKTIELLILLIVILIALTGCAQINYQVEINDDGSGEISYIYGVSKEISEYITVEDYINEFKEQAEESNYKVEFYEDDIISGFRASKHIENLNTEFSLQEAFGEEYVKDTENNGIKIEKSLFITKYSQTAELDLTTLSKDEQGITMTYQVKLPVKTLTNNATEISKDNKTLKWNLIGGEINKIEFKAQKINILPIVIIVIVVIAIIIAVVIIKKHATKVKTNI